MVFNLLFCLSIVNEIFLRYFILVIALSECKFHRVWVLLNLELTFLHLLTCLHILILSVSIHLLQSFHSIFRVFLHIPIYRFLPSCLSVYRAWLLINVQFLVLIPLPRHVANAIIEELVKVKSTFSKEIHTTSRDSKMPDI